MPTDRIILAFTELLDLLDLINTALRRQEVYILCSIETLGPSETKGNLMVYFSSLFQGDTPEETAFLQEARTALMNSGGNFINFDSAFAQLLYGSYNESQVRYILDTLHDYVVQAPQLYEKMFGTDIPSQGLPDEIQAHAGSLNEAELIEKLEDLEERLERLEIGVRTHNQSIDTSLEFIHLQLSDLKETNQVLIQYLTKSESLTQATPKTTKKSTYSWLSTSKSK